MGGSGSKTEKFGPDSAGYELTIQYCGGWGYRSKAVFAQQQVTKQFGDDIHIVFKRDSGVTGNFEITIENKKTGEKRLVHSKKNGDGFVKGDNQDEFIAKLKDFIKS